MRTLFFERSRGLSGIVSLLVGLCVSSACADGTVSRRAGMMQRHDVRVEVEEIRYIGEDDYRIEMSLTNNSEARIILEAADRAFSVQTETGWLPLREKDIEGSFTGKGPIPAGGMKKTASTVHIPPQAPHLFRTYEGDLSLLLRYELRYGVHGRPSNIKKQSEEYYWISPRTGKWLHREGM